MRHIRMPEKLWSAIPHSNKSEWIRTAIRMRLARNKHGLKDECIEALIESETQVRRVGITLNQIARNLNISTHPSKEIIFRVKEIMNDIQKLKSIYYLD